ncbi:hypothetical protein [Crenothrix sp.]|uniref:hypothetical protein n=1 Tax=Crenothrix sp. TaxID=3100433 RepID=UPI00374CB41F
MNKKPCAHEYLATTEFGHVVICKECGRVTVLLQNMSLQFSVEAFMGVANTLNEAAEKIITPTQQKPIRPSLKMVKH